MRSFRLPAFIIVVIALLLPSTFPVYSADLSIKTRTKYYGFQAKRFRNVARQMRRHGPSFRGYGRRVWAMAHRQYDWDIDYNRQRGKCSPKRVKVKMKITYTMPRLENETRVSAKFLSKWRRVYNILHRHELTHGRNYRLLARRLKAGLLKLAPRRNCFALKRAAKKLDEKLHKLDIKRNRRFETGERSRFTRLQRRIERS